MATLTHESPPLISAKRPGKPKDGGRTTNTRGTKRRRLSQIISTTPQQVRGDESSRQSNLQVAGPEIPEVLPDIVIKGLMVYVVKKGVSQAQEHPYYVQPATSCDYLRGLPAIRHCLNNFISKTGQKEGSYTEMVGPFRVEKMQSCGLTDSIQSRAMDVKISPFREENLLILIKTQVSERSVPIQYIKSPRNMNRLDECFGESIHRLLRVMAVYQGSDNLALNVETREEVGLAIKKVDGILSQYYLRCKEWKVSRPDNLIVLADRLPHLPKPVLCQYKSRWYLWKGQPAQALALIDRNRDILGHDVMPVEVWALHELGEVKKAKELRDRSPSAEGLQVAYHALFVLVEQDIDQRQKHLTRAFDQLKEPKNAKFMFAFYAVKGCFLYHKAMAASEDKASELMRQSIKYWRQALETTKTKGERNTSMTSFVAKLTICALKLKIQSEDADETFKSLMMVEQEQLIYYYPYILKQWVDIMYTILGEHGKHGYVEKRPQRIEDSCS
ncbi:hypothetical protein FHETE_11387 [Fusarium heterosporum]|uniref:Uncharacterized protein n=1 Tax=Fusarium heterosporum TaxID=42747 RepID=A0A8H5SKZ1_FUSHE|nr:hypothetical protein FHETE_11387 [Fusarium heterosporum]